MAREAKQSKLCVIRKPANDNKTMSHKERMAARRVEQTARVSTTIVMTREKWRGLVARLRADNVARPRDADGHLAPLKKFPTVHVILTSKYMPHQGKRERARRRQRSVSNVQYAEAA